MKSLLSCLASILIISTSILYSYKYDSNKHYALISVYDKTDVEKVAFDLIDRGLEIISTGGTYEYLKKHIPQDKLHQVSEITRFPEILEGRVKTLHPKIAGGILAKTGKEDDVIDNEIPVIDVVISNLYPFEKVITKEHKFEDAIENIDIGGPNMVRAAAKNFKRVTIIVDPADYAMIAKNYDQDIFNRLNLAEKASSYIENYCSKNVSYFKDIQNLVGELKGRVDLESLVTIYSDKSDKEESKATSNTNYQDAQSQFVDYSRSYEIVTPMKYGFNPHQKQAFILKQSVQKSPLKFLNDKAKPSMTNLEDALGGWQLVRELSELFGPCAASLKHTSPAGVGLGKALSRDLCDAYGIENQFKLSRLAVSFIRARNADSKSSFGDFIALSSKVDKCTAELIAKEVSDGIIATGYDEDALDILKKKKGGTYLIIEIDPSYENENIFEIKEVFGIPLCQEPNKLKITQDLLKNIVSQNKDLPIKVQDDLLLALITLKYTKSNSIVFAVDGQVIGVGCGQQNRVDCIKIAGKKADIWRLRQHPRVLNLIFKPTVTRVERTNRTLDFIKGKNIDSCLQENAIPLSKKEKSKFLSINPMNVVMASDAFLPFEDNIEEAAKYGVKYIVQTGGSTRDKEVTEACNKLGIVHIHSGIRLFTH